MIVSVALQICSDMTPNEETIRLCQLRDEGPKYTESRRKRKKERHLSRLALIRDVTQLGGGTCRGDATGWSAIAMIYLIKL